MCFTTCCNCSSEQCRNIGLCLRSLTASSCSSFDRFILAAVVLRGKNSKPERRETVQSQDRPKSKFVQMIAMKMGSWLRTMFEITVVKRKIETQCGGPFQRRVKHHPLDYRISYSLLLLWGKVESSGCKLSEDPT